MRVSVVVPAYNVADFLDECLRSVLGEADGGVELVCVDDGSTDATWEIASAFAEGRGVIVKAVRQENAGAGAARNAGLAVATGDWIMFLDGDDVLAKGWLSLVRSMASRHPSAEMLGFGRTEAWPVEPVGGSFESREVDVSRVVGIDAYERGMWQYAYRRDLIGDLEFERMYALAAKADYWRILNSFPGVFSYEALKASEPRNELFEAYRQRKVIYSNMKQQAYYEIAPVEPDVLLKDFVAIFHPDLIEPDYEPKYYKLLKE